MLCNRQFFSGNSFKFYHMKYLLAILTLSICLTGFAQRGKVYDNLTVTSDILGMERNYAVYLPPDYESSSRSYPVLYLLHGAGDDHTGWVQFGEVLHITDKAINAGEATPMIIIMPDAKTRQMGYFNTPGDKWRFEDFFFEELMPHVEDKFRIKKEKRYRAISGLSMGGGGTFTYAIHRPDLFSSAVPMSAYIGPASVEQLQQQVERMNFDGTIEELRTYWESINALSLIEKGDAKAIGSVRWFIDCGDDDFLFEGNSLIHIAMRKKNIPHEYRVRQGGHTWTYWRESLPMALKFVSDAFHQY